MPPLSPKTPFDSLKNPNLTRGGAFALMNIPDSHTSRTGKIARLPLVIRQQLNERLENGEPNRRLVRWLNSLEPVRQRLAEYFEGRPINENNLSAWKQGGFRDWQRHQRPPPMARDFLDAAVELEDEVSEFHGHDRGSFLDHVNNTVALSLMQLFREMEDAEPGPARTRAMLEIVREMDRLRRAHHQRLRMAVTDGHRGRERKQAPEAAEEKERKNEAK